MAIDTREMGTCVNHGETYNLISDYSTICACYVLIMFSISQLQIMRTTSLQDNQIAVIFGIIFQFNRFILPVEKFLFYFSVLVVLHRSDKELTFHHRHFLPQLISGVGSPHHRFFIDEHRFLYRLLSHRFVV